MGNYGILKKNHKRGIIMVNKEDKSDFNGSALRENKPVILIVSFGTTCKNSRKNAIGAIEEAVLTENNDFEVRRAFTSKVVIDIIKKKDGEENDDIGHALNRLIEEGVKTLVVQPTHIICGNEYDKLCEIVGSYKNKFEKLSVGVPLLTADDDYIKVADILTKEASKFTDEKTAVVFIGHGIEHDTNPSYVKLQNTFLKMKRTGFFVGTVKSAPTPDDVIASLKAGGYKRVVLFPLMTVAGTHAKKDISGDKTDSWKSLFSSSGFEVECVLKGLGEIKAIQNIYVSHTKNAICKLNK